MYPQRYTKRKIYLILINNDMNTNITFMSTNITFTYGK